jgi:phage terminase small subunit
MSEVLDDELRVPGEYGPAMERLDARKQRFVEAVLDQRGRPNYALAAREAGYSDHLEAAKVQAYHLMRSPRIIEALHEESRRRFTILGYHAVHGLADIAEKADHPDRFKALKELADRFGYAAVTEHTVKVQHTDLTGQALLNRIAALASKHGLDPQKLIGSNVADGSQVVEAQAVEVRDADTGNANDSGG